MLRLLIFSIGFIFIFAFNPCNIDQFACVPLVDFEVNCTCILQDNHTINNTDEVFLFFEGWQIPLELFTQKVMPKLFREKLQIRIPPSTDYESSLEMPETVYQNMEITEQMTLFLASSKHFENFIRAFADEGLITTSQLRDNLLQWCAEGECAVFVDETFIENRTEGVYNFSVDLLHAIEMSGKTIFALSSVSAHFSIPLVQAKICEFRCKTFYWNEKKMCEIECTKRLRFDRVSLIGEIKQNFHHFVRATAVWNFREKYKNFLGSGR